MFRRILGWLRAVMLRSRVERELDDEIRFHIEEETAAGLRSGLTLKEARQRAYATLGAPAVLIREKCNDERGLSRLDEFVRDLKHGVRLLLRSPQFSTVVLATLAIAIG